jgi:hypothetical protein
MRRLRWLGLWLLMGCTEIVGPVPSQPLLYVDCGETPEDPVCAEPSPNPPPACTAPLVVWWWYEGEESGWFCAPPPWW